MTELDSPCLRLRTVVACLLAGCGLLLHAEQPFPNADFEQGTFEGWEVHEGWTLRAGMHFPANVRIGHQARGDIQMPALVGHFSASSHDERERLARFYTGKDISVLPKTLVSARLEITRPWLTLMMTGTLFKIKAGTQLMDWFPHPNYEGRKPVFLGEAFSGGNMGPDWLAPFGGDRVYRSPWGLFDTWAEWTILRMRAYRDPQVVGFEPFEPFAAVRDFFPVDVYPKDGPTTTGSHTDPTPSLPTASSSCCVRRAMNWACA